MSLEIKRTDGFEGPFFHVQWICEDKVPREGVLLSCGPFSRTVVLNEPEALALWEQLGVILGKGAPCDMDAPIPVRVTPKGEEFARGKDFATPQKHRGG